jgi:hypothetical protein
MSQAIPCIMPNIPRRHPSSNLMEGGNPVARGRLCTRGPSRMTPIEPAPPNDIPAHQTRHPSPRVRYEQQRQRAEGFVRHRNAFHFGYHHSLHFCTLKFKIRFNNVSWVATAIDIIEAAAPWIENEETSLSVPLFFASNRTVNEMPQIDVIKIGSRDKNPTKAQVTARSDDGYPHGAQPQRYL